MMHREKEEMSNKIESDLGKRNTKLDSIKKNAIASDLDFL